MMTTNDSPRMQALKKELVELIENIQDEHIIQQLLVFVRESVAKREKMVSK